MTTRTTTEPPLPVYRRNEVPEHLQHLRTMTELKAQRQKPAPGQQPITLLRVYRRGHGRAVSDCRAVVERLREMAANTQLGLEGSEA